MTIASQMKTENLMLDFLKRQGEVADKIGAVEWQWLELQQKLEESA